MAVLHRARSATASGSAFQPRGGQPLIAFALILAMWIGARIVLWQSPFPAFVAAEQILAHGPNVPLPGGKAPLLMPEPMPEMAVSGSHSSTHLAHATLRLPVPQLASVRDRSVFASERFRTSTGAGLGHHLLLMNALSWSAASPRGLSGSAIFSVTPPSMVPSARTATNAVRDKLPRWSADSWLFLRSADRQIARAGATFGIYGASQAGTVLRYRLRPDSAIDPKAYVRIVQSLAAPSQSDAALGLSVRPFAEIPVAAMAELRATRIQGATELRPALLAVTEISPLELPLGTRMSAYGQAGYVGGKFATAFADGHAVVDRAVTQFDLAELRAGAGVWGGAQQGVHRVDLGPTVQARMRLADVPVTIGVDYRHRVEGNAEPQSGMALTVSTSF